MQRQSPVQLSVSIGTKGRRTAATEGGGRRGRGGGWPKAPRNTRRKTWDKCCWHCAIAAAAAAADSHMAWLQRVEPGCGPLEVRTKRVNSLELRLLLCASSGCIVQFSAVACCPTDVAVVVVAHPDPGPLRTCGSYFWTESLWRFH